MSKIETGRFSDLLRRYLGMSGTSDIAQELAPEISPVFVLEDSRPEWEFLKGQKLMAVYVPQPGGGAVSTAVRIRNPPSSGVVGIITNIVVAPSALSEIRYKLGNDAGNLGTTYQSVSRDTRYPRVAFPGNSALITSGGTGNNGDQFYGTAVPTNEPHIYGGGTIVLTPGFQLQIETVVNNLTLLVAFAWLEKKLDPLEQER